jgi:hypothetical protein
MTTSNRRGSSEGYRAQAACGFGLRDKTVQELETE